MTGLVSARVVAEATGMSRAWVYANAARLGGRRGPAGPTGKAPVRFDLDQALAAFEQLSAEPAEDTVAAAPPRRPTRTAVPLLPIGRAA